MSRCRRKGEKRLTVGMGEGTVWPRLPELPSCPHVVRRSGAALGTSLLRKVTPRPGRGAEAQTLSLPGALLIAKETPRALRQSTLRPVPR